MSNFVPLNDEEAKSILKKIEKNMEHSKCVNNILTINDMYFQKFCLERKNQFFPLNQNKFLHISCNKLVIEKLKKIRKEQIDLFSQSINTFLQHWKKMNLLIECEKLNTTFNILYKLCECKNEIRNGIICAECKKLINMNYIEKHFSTCKVSKCLFIHADGQQCENIKHNKKIHTNFISKNDLIIKNPIVNCKKFDMIFNVNNMKKTNEIIVFKTKNSLSYINILVKTFYKGYNIISKNCKCFISLHTCQCFLYCLNNCNIDLFLKRKDKTLHRAIDDSNKNPLLFKKTISIINVNKNIGPTKFVDFSFLSTFRKNNFVKLIFLHNSDIDFY